MQDGTTITVGGTMFKDVEVAGTTADGLETVEAGATQTIDTNTEARRGLAG